MDDVRIEAILRAFASGSVTVDDARAALRAAVPPSAPPAELPYATVDLDRPRRTGFPEVVYGAGKSADQIVGIFFRLIDAGQAALATRVDAAKAAALVERLQDATARWPEIQVAWHPLAEVVLARVGPGPVAAGRVGVVDAGTSDRRVSEEAAVVAAAMGAEVWTLHDVGIAGVHRVLAHVEALRACRVVVVVAGMDGALPGLVAGLVAVPVIAVPTSVGYGASFGGVAALLTMLNACAPGVTVVNIDNGFGAGYAAALVNRAGGPA